MPNLYFPFLLIGMLCICIQVQRTTKETTIDTSISNIFELKRNIKSVMKYGTYQKLSSKQLETALEIIETVHPEKSPMPVTDDTYGFPLPRSRR